MAAMVEQMGFDCDTSLPQRFAEQQAVFNRDNIVIFGVDQKMRWRIGGNIAVGAVIPLRLLRW